MHNNGGIVIAQVKRIAKAGALKPQQVLVPGIVVDCVVVAPDQMQTTQTVYDPAISGEKRRADRQLRPRGVGRREGDRPARGAGTAPGGMRSISASASRPTCRASSSRKGSTEPSPGSSSRARSAACPCSTSSSAAPRTPRRSCLRPISSPISRAPASTPRCCPSCRSIPRAVGQRLQARRPAPCHGRGRRLRRYHGARPQDRVLRLLQRRGLPCHRTRPPAVSREGKVRKLVRKSSTSPSPVGARSRKVRTSLM